MSSTSAIATGSIELVEVHAFSSAQGGGNPAGVVLAAAGLSHEQKQAIAASAGYSETAFVLPSTVASVRLEFFTPNRQIGDCGHATVAAFSLLRDRGLLGTGDASKEILAGVRAIRIEPDAVYMQQAQPSFDSALSEAASAAWLQALAASDVRLLAPAQIGSTGGRFVLLPLADEPSLRRLQPDLPALEQLSEQYDVIGIYPFVPTPERDTVASARMFAPRFGIPEESATGIAAGALGCWLARTGRVSQRSFWIAQGDDMPQPSPSRLHVQLLGDASNADAMQPWVGGSAHIGGIRQLTLR
ncbi:MAG: PhzF family phenazine biosynthesis protein [Pseudomonadota bacterium]